MTPLEIDILLHYHCRVGDYREGDFSAPAVRSAIDRFRDEDFLLREATNTTFLQHRTYELTERGSVYVKALTEVPLPVQVWVMPTAA